MSDLEDYEILEEIKALENALALDTSTQPFSHEISETAVDLPLEKSSISSTIKEESTSNTIQQINDLTSKTFQNESDFTFMENDVDEYRNAFNLNKKLIEYLHVAKNEITSILEECNQKLKLMDDRLHQHTKSWTSSKAAISIAGMPYFKSKDYFPAPQNDDTKLKAARGELQIVNLRKVCRWTPKDRNTLLRAVRHEAISSILHDHETIETEIDKTINAKSKSMNETKHPNKFLPKDFKELIGPLRTREFDWLKIAAVDFNGKHSAEECCVMWNVFLHPEINKCKWTKTEDSKLKKIAERHNFQDWDSIAQELNKKRSGYQCFIRSNTSKQATKLKCHTWLPKEDEKLSDVVTKLRIGDFVPWGEVASCMCNRTKQQVYFRWTYSLAPHLKKGRFTKEEDTTLLEGVIKFGPNFRKISALLMPHRSTIQLSDHYHTLISREQGNSWTVTEDAKLIELYNEIGPNWSKIATYFSCKSRTQLRHRYSALLRATEKGISIFELPRQYNGDKFEEDIHLSENDVHDVIDKQLIEYFYIVSTLENSNYRKGFYNPEKALNNTKELYNILRLLNSNLHIPDKLEYIRLSDTEKELLYSLKTYVHEKDDPKGNSSRIEEYRIKMFGSHSNVKDHFIPPLPFDAYTKIKKCKQTKSIDYDLSPNNKFTVEVSKELQTPDSIIFFIGSDQEIQFQKLSNLFNTINNRLPDTFTEINTSSNALKEREIKTSLEIVPSTSDSSIYTVDKCQQSLKLPICKPFMNKTDKSISTNAVPLEGLSESVNIRSHESFDQRGKEKGEPKDTIKPNHATLLSFKHLISSKELFDLENMSNTTLDYEYNGTVECKEAYYLLKRRLLQLFKYPICLSHILLPEVHGADTIFSYDTNDNSTNKRKIIHTSENANKRIKIGILSSDFGQNANT